MRASLRRANLFVVVFSLAISLNALAQTYHAYFGDMHSHSTLSWDANAGAKPPAQAYAYAKHVAKTDFMAISDHTNGLPQANYEIIRTAAAAYDRPESLFVAIAGQELGSLGATGYGHMNIFEAPTIAGNGLDNDAIRYNLQMAYQFVIDNNVSAQFNHPSTENGNSNFLGFEYFQSADVGMSSIEVINGTRSTNYERYYLLALQKGWHVGALGDQDNHGPYYGNLRASDGDIYLTGVLAEELTKPKILEAIRGHRTYAFETNPANDRIYLDSFKAEGHWMGEIFNDNDAHVTLEISAHSAPATNTRFRQAQLYRNGYLLAWKNLSTASFTWTFEDSASTGPHYYHAKLVQEDGDLLWTSPIWVNSPGAAPALPNVMTIRSLRQNFSDGVPQSFGWANVRVRGIATAGTHFGDSGPGYLQDSTGGIAVFGGDFTKSVVVGPPSSFEMEVYGAVSLFNGSIEILPYSVARVGVKPAVVPQLVTLAQLTANGESYEGRLVKISNARIVSGSYPSLNNSGNLTIDDGTGSFTMRIDDGTDIDGQPTPVTRLDIIGIVNQFDPTLPYTDGYQILPRRLADITTTNAVAEHNETPREFRLEQNYPNPFASSAFTALRFVLPNAANVRLEIFNVMGERVALLQAERYAAGAHAFEWDGRDQFGTAVASGVYFYRLAAEELGVGGKSWNAVRKLILMR